MADYIRTYTGKHYVPSEPDPALFCIEDFAHALSLLCRGNGHVKSFWSVGEHCILCAREAEARGLPARMVLACLLHDACECYLSDLPRPFKKDMRDYQALEERTLELIYSKFLGSPLSKEEQRLLKEIDDAMLWYDLKYLLGGENVGPEPKVHVVPDYAVRPFTEVEREYLEIYCRCSRLVDQEGTVPQRSAFMKERFREGFLFRQGELSVFV